MHRKLVKTCQNDGVEAKKFEKLAYLNKRTCGDFLTNQNKEGRRDGKNE